MTLSEIAECTQSNVVPYRFEPYPLHKNLNHETNRNSIETDPQG